VRVKPVPLPEGPNPAASASIHVEPFVAVFAVVEGLGVISLHRTQEEAQAALAAELERREQRARSHVNRLSEPQASSLAVIAAPEAMMGAEK
jgi:hypothetical protein